MIKWIFGAIVSVFSVVIAGTSLMKSLALFGLVETQADSFERIISTEANTVQNLEVKRAEIVKLARRSLRQEPLDPAPFSALLRHQPEDFDANALSGIVEQLNRVAPRHRMSKLAEVQLALSAEDMGKAVDLLAQLIELDQDNQRTYTGVIAELAYSEDGKQAIERLLETHPSWAEAFIRDLIARSDDIDFVRRVVKNYPDAHRFLVGDLVNRGDYDRAFIAFLDLLPADQIEAMTIPYNNAFEEMPGAQPFNWRVNSRYGGFDPDGLYLSFFGRRNSMIVDQVFSLSPGPFAFSTRMSGRLYLNGSSLTWRLRCVDDNSVLMDLSINELFSTVTAFNSEFEVPATGCTYQKLQLVGMPGEFPRTARAQVKSVMITPAERAAP